MHLDLRCGDVESEVEQMLELGAQVLESQPNVIVLKDPEGNEFCVLRP